MSAMYGQSSLQQIGNGQLPHLGGSSTSLSNNNNSSSSSTTNGPNSNELNSNQLNNNGLLDANGHLLIQPKQEPDIDARFMQL